MHSAVQVNSLTSVADRSPVLRFNNQPRTQHMHQLHIYWAGFIKGPAEQVQVSQGLVASEALPLDRLSSSRSTCIGLW